jgi:hypothetical protein
MNISTQTKSLTEMRNEVIRAKDANEWPSIDMGRVAYRFKTADPRLCGSDWVYSEQYVLGEASEGDQIMVLDFLTQIDHTNTTPVAWSDQCKKASQVVFTLI